MATKTRFGLAIGGHVRCVLSVAENSKMDLTLFLRASTSPVASNPGPNLVSEKPHPDMDLKEYRYSIHVSDESPSRINTMKFTRIHKDLREYTMVYYTKAIKQHNCFSFVFTKRCSSMLDPYYNIRNDKAELIILDTMPGHIMSMFISVFVGPPNREFALDAGPLDFKFRQIKYNRFSLVILWTFLPVSPHHSSSTAHSEVDESQIVRSLDEKGCITSFLSSRWALRNQYVEILNKDLGSAKWKRITDRIVFVPTPSFESPEVQAWSSELRSKGLIA